MHQNDERIISHQIREDLFENPRVIKMIELTTNLTNWMIAGGIAAIKDSTKKHVRRNLETEFGDSLKFVQDLKGKVLVFPDSLSQDFLVKRNAKLESTIKDLEAKCDT